MFVLHNHRAEELQHQAIVVDRLRVADHSTTAAHRAIAVAAVAHIAAAVVAAVAVAVHHHEVHRTAVVEAHARVEVHTRVATHEADSCLTI